MQFFDKFLDRTKLQLASTSKKTPKNSFKKILKKQKKWILNPVVLLT